MLDEDEGAATSSRSTACSSSTRSGKLSAPFYFHDNKPHECSQTWQVVRSEFDQMMLDNAREHGVDVARRRARARRALRRRPGRRRARPERGRHAAGGARQGRRRRQRPERADCRTGFKPARVGPGPEQGRHLDLLRRAPTATPAATKARRSSSRRPNKQGWFWYIPLHDDIVSVGVVAPFDYLFKDRGRLTSRSYNEEVERCPRRQEAHRAARRARPATSRPRTTRTARRKSPATAGCWSATRSASSIRSTRPACCSR